MRSSQVYCPHFAAPVKLNQVALRLQDLLCRHSAPTAQHNSRILFPAELGLRKQKTETTGPCLWCSMTQGPKYDKKASQKSKGLSRHSLARLKLRAVYNHLAEAFQDLLAGLRQTLWKSDSWQLHLSSHDPLCRHLSTATLQCKPKVLSIA